MKNCDLTDLIGSVRSISDCFPVLDGAISGLSEQFAILVEMMFFRLYSQSFIDEVMQYTYLCAVV